MILILDFGSQYTQLIARRVREAHVYCEIHPYSLPLETHQRAWRPRASSCPAARRACTRRTRRCPIRDVARARRAGARDLLRHGRARPVRGRRRSVGARRTRASTGRPSWSSTTTRSLRRASRRRHDPVWMSHGDRIEGSRAAGRCSRTARTPPIAACADRGAPPVRRSSSIPEVVHTPRGARSWRISSSASAAPAPTGRWRTSSSARRARIRARVGTAGVVCASQRRRRLDRDRRPDPPRHRRPADLHLRRQRRAAPRRGRRASCSSCGDAFHFRIKAVDAGALFLRAARRRRGSGAEAAHHRRHVHRGVRGGGAAAARRRASWRRGRSIRTSSSRCRSRGRRATIKSHHNVGGLPERMHLQADRAAARAVQGRGARAGRGPRHSRRDHRAPPVSRARGWRSASSARSTAERVAVRAGRRRDRRRGDPRRRLVRAALAGLRRAAAGEDGRRHGRRAHLRERRWPSAPSRASTG